LRGGWCVRVIIIGAAKDINRAGVALNVNRPTFDPLELRPFGEHRLKLGRPVSSGAHKCSALVGVLAEENVATCVWIRDGFEVGIICSAPLCLTEVESLIADLTSLGVFNSHATPRPLGHPLNVRRFKR
jgi:hypothetical protein